MTSFFDWLRCLHIRRLLRQRRDRRTRLAIEFRRTIVRRCGPINVSLWAEHTPEFAVRHHYYVWTYSPRQRFVWVLDQKAGSASAFRAAAKLALEPIEERTR